MNVFFSLRRITLVVALATVGLAWPLPAQAGEFSARGTFLVISEDGQGHRNELTNEGIEESLGEFTGTASGKQLPNGNAIGVGTFDFGNGDTLTYDYKLKYDEETGLLMGTYVITGGTGDLEGASGSGDVIAAPAGDGTGTLAFDGTLSTP